MKNCNCFFCKNNDEFDMPIFLLDQIKEGNVVLFAGAGISTESEIVLPYSLYDDVADDLELSEDNEFSFPELMTQYTNKPNGRISLLKKIKKRFDYISSFPDFSHSRNLKTPSSTCLLSSQSAISSVSDPESCSFTSECENCNKYWFNLDC